MRGPTETAAFILPIAPGDGEGDHAKHGGGVTDEASAI
jgi:hypothetical protein